MNNIKLDWNDISIVPEVLSDISSRKEINPFVNGKLPLFTAPMDMVIDQTNANIFDENNINVCLPRHVKYDLLKNDNYFYSYGLDEIIELVNTNQKLPKKVLIDIANGHMKKLYDIAKTIKEKYDVELMVGNIANPETYKKYCEIGVDYVRANIGSGSACTTSINVSIHYPSASLISECAKYKKDFEKPTKIVADGGFKNFSDIIKALALGADYVMIGSLFNKCIESCSDTYIKQDGKMVKLNDKVDFTKNIEYYKYYRGMSTKEVQISWNKGELKTAEGISKYNKVEYSLSGWCENFTDYLRSAMSYTNSRTLDMYIGNVDWVVITQNAFNRFNK